MKKRKNAQPIDRTSYKAIFELLEKHNNALRYMADQVGCPETIGRLIIHGEFVIAEVKKINSVKVTVIGSAPVFVGGLKNVH